MKKSGSTLVILTPGFPENEADTTCLPAQQIFVKALHKTYPEITIIVLSFQYPFAKKSYYWNGIRVFAFNGNNRGGLARLRVWSTVFVKLHAISKQQQLIGLFSFWCTECALVGKYFSIYKNTKHIAWISGQDARKQNRFVKFIRPKPRELAAMSEFLSNEFYKNHSILPATVIPNGIDTSEFEPARVEKDIDMCAVGSLIKLKQYEKFIEIASRLKQQIPLIKTVICGKGPEETNLRLLINTLELNENVSLAGERSHPEVLAIMQRTKVFLHPSSYEGLSSVCMEALYAGAHVISFTDPGFGAISHWHVVSDEETMFKKALEILLDEQSDYSPVLVYSMVESAKRVMQLFNP